MLTIDPKRLAGALQSDGEFLRACRLWTGSFAFFDGETHVLVEVKSGKLADVRSGSGEPQAGVVFTGPADGWASVFSAVPPAYYQDLIGGAVGRHGFTIRGDTLAMAAYYGAIQRAARLAGQSRGGDD